MAVQLEQQTAVDKKTGTHCTKPNETAETRSFQKVPVIPLYNLSISTYHIAKCIVTKSTRISLLKIVQHSLGTLEI